MAPLYEVEQTLARRRIIEVVASNQEEAKRLAKEGHGEVISEESDAKLLADSAKKVGS